MPLKFTSVCDLFDALEKIEHRDPPYLRDRKAVETRSVVQAWFRQHRAIIDKPDTNGTAILSTLFPERRTDRVYCIKEARLQRLVARCLNLSVTKSKELGAWQVRGNGDLGACVERVQRDYDAAPLPGRTPLSVEDVDGALRDLASTCRFSGPAVREVVSAAVPVDILTPLFRRTHSREAKWLVRLILKDFGRVVIDESLVLSEFHFMLPSLLRFQNDYSAVMALLRGPLLRYHAKPDLQSQKLMLEDAAKYLEPRIGVKVGRPTWYKARSMGNCLQMVGNGEWIIERKYDGEFCEIHIDLTGNASSEAGLLRPDTPCIKIFSKAGKDATQDRQAILDTIRSCLKIGHTECKFKRKCILLGELIVYSDLEQNVLEFHKIRKYVSRSGSFLGTDRDSQLDPDEHLAIVFFDVLLVDDEITMTRPHKERRERLSQLYTKIPGRAMSAEWMKLDFSDSQAKKSLVTQFAAALSFRCEGLILKPNAPYFSLAEDETGIWCKGFIKLKKDYMTDMGGERDVADFAIIGASYEAKQAQKCNLPNIRWTNFYLGCLVSKEDIRFHCRPTFRVVAIIKQEHCISAKDLNYLNDHGNFRSEDYNSAISSVAFHIELGANPAPKVLFTNPFVAEVLGSAFEKPPNEDFFMLRHPRILRTHTDRSWEDCTTMDELRHMADEAQSAPPEGESQNIRETVDKMLAKLERVKERQTQHSSRQTTPRNVSSIATSDTISPVLRKPGRGTAACFSPLSRSSPRKMIASITQHEAQSSRQTTPRFLATSISPVSAMNTKENFPCTVPHGTFCAKLASSETRLGEEATPVSQQSTQPPSTIVTPLLPRNNHREPLAVISPPVKASSSGRPVLSRQVSPTTDQCTRIQSRKGPVLSQHNARARKALGSTGNEYRGDSILPPILILPELSRCTLPHSRGCEDTATRFPEHGQNARSNISRGVSPRRDTLKADAKRSATALARRTDTMDPLVAEDRDAHHVRDFTNTMGLESCQPASTRIDELNQRSQAIYIGISTPPAASCPTASERLLPTPPISSAPSASRTQAPSSKLIDHPISTSSTSFSKALEGIPKPITAPAAPTRDTTPSPSTSALARPNPRKRLAVDDFSLNLTPRRKMHRKQSHVQGLPALPLTLSPIISVCDPPLPAGKPAFPTYDLSHSTVYLAPSIQHHHRLMAMLLPHSGVAALVPDLAHWVRDTEDKLGLLPMGEVVGESQAFEGLRRVVLVEPMRRGEVEMVRERAVQLGLGGGRGRDGVLVEMFDWRVLEDLMGVEVDVEAEGEGGDGGAYWERRFCGKV